MNQEIVVANNETKAPSLNLKDNTAIESTEPSVASESIDNDYPRKIFPNCENNVFVKRQSDCFNDLVLQQEVGEKESKTNPFCYFDQNGGDLIFTTETDNSSIIFKLYPTSDLNIKYYKKVPRGNEQDFFIYSNDNFKSLDFCREIVINSPKLTFSYSLFQIFSFYFFRCNDYLAAVNINERYSFLKKKYYSEHDNKVCFKDIPFGFNDRDSLIKSKIHGDIQWQTFSACLDQNLLTKEGIPTGAHTIDHHNDSYPIHYSGGKHLTTIAPNGSGKGSCVQIPVLLEYEGSMFVIDPKGENAAVTAKYRKEVLGHEVFIINPFRVLEESFVDLGFTGDSGTFNPSGFNPLSILGPDNQFFVSGVSSLCEILVDSQSSGNSDSFWNDSARELIACIVMFVCITEEYGSEKRNLNEVRQILTLPESALILLLSTIAGMDIGGEDDDSSSTDIDGGTDTDDEEEDEDILISTNEKDKPRKSVLTDIESISSLRLFKAKSIDYPPLEQKAGAFTKSSKSFQSVIATALTQTSFLDDPILAQSLSQDDIDFYRLKKEKITVYLILPAHLLVCYSKWFKVLVNSALNQFMSDAGQGEKNVLMMLDECAILGRLQSLETAIGLARGFGLQLWTFWQDIHQLIDIYGRKHESFLANSGVHQYFTPNDTKVAKQISERLGKTTRYSVSVNKTENRDETYNRLTSSQTSESTNEVSVDFMPMVNLFSLEENKQIMFLYGQKEAFFADKIPYYKNKYLKDRAEKNPYINN